MTSVSKPDISSYLHKLSILKPLIPVLLIIITSFLLISCEGGVYNSSVPEVIYTYDYDSVAYKLLGGLGHEHSISIDFSNVDNIILSYDYKSNVNFILQILVYRMGNTPPFEFFNYASPLEESSDYKSRTDTLVVTNKAIADKFQITFYQDPWLDSNRYSVIKNLKIIKLY
jgi:hypothetical protein